MKNYQTRQERKGVGLRPSVVLLSIFVLCRPLFPQSAEAKFGQLTVIIDGLENDQGKVLVALCNSEKDFESSGKTCRLATLGIMKKQASITLDDLPPGMYALKAFHDENGDGELNTDFLGIPNENYGFSNNARGTFGPPSWDDAKFMLKLPADTVRILIE